MPLVPMKLKAMAEMVMPMATVVLILTQTQDPTIVTITFVAIVAPSL